jgi:hypothetical protein
VWAGFVKRDRERERRVGMDDGIDHTLAHIKPMTPDGARPLKSAVRAQPYRAVRIPVPAKRVAFLGGGKVDRTQERGCKSQAPRPEKCSPAPPPPSTFTFLALTKGRGERKCKKIRNECYRIIYNQSLSFVCLFGPFSP